MSIAKLLKEGLARYKIRHPHSTSRRQRRAARLHPDLLLGTSKHSKAKTKPKRYIKKQKARRKAAKLMRRRNR